MCVVCFFVNYAAAPEIYPYSHTPSLHDALPIFRAQFASDDYDIALVRDAAGALLGYIKMGPLDFELPDGQPADGAVELHQLYVAEAAKGTGVAAALIAWGIASARERSSIPFLTVFTENDPARAFYRRYWCTPAPPPA